MIHNKAYKPRSISSNYFSVEQRARFNFESGMRKIRNKYEINIILVSQSFSDSSGFGKRETLQTNGCIIVTKLNECIIVTLYKKAIKWNAKTTGKLVSPH